MRLNLVVVCGFSGVLLSACQPDPLLRPPDAPEVSLGDQTVGTASDLELELVTESVAQNGGELSYRLEWRVDQEDMAELGSVEVFEGDSRIHALSADYTEKEQLWVAWVVAVETVGESTVESAPARSFVRVVNTPPSLESAQLSPAEAFEWTVFDCTPVGANDPDGDETELEVSWFVDGMEVSDQSTLDGGFFGKGQEVYCQLRLSDGEAWGEAVLSDAVQILNAAPEISSLELSPESPDKSSPISVSVVGAADADGDSVDFLYHWFVEGVDVSQAATLEPTLFSRGQSVYVEVTPFDGEDGGEPIVSDPVVVANTLAVVDLVTVGPEFVSTTGDLTCSVEASTDLDGDTLSFDYSWFVDGTEVSDTTQVLSAVGLAQGATVQCGAVPQDGFDEGVGAVSGFAWVNHRPVVSNVAVTPDPATVANTVLTCGHDTPTDQDGDSVGEVYSWETSTNFVAGDSSTLEAGLVRGDQVRCSVTPGDWLEDGDTVASAWLEISNFVPVVDSVTLSPDPPTTNEDLVATVSSTDLDEGDPVNYQYDWYVNGSLISGYNHSILPGVDYFDYDDIVEVGVTPNDSIELGQSEPSQIVTVVNSAPEPPVIALSPRNPTPEDDLVCSVSGAFTDADSGQQPTYTFDWEVGGVAFSQATDANDNLSSTVSSGETNDGERWSCQVTVEDGAGGTAQSTQTTAHVAADASESGGCGIYLDGSTSIDLGEPIELNRLLDGNFSIEMFVKLDSLGATQRLFRRGDKDGSQSQYIDFFVGWTGYPEFSIKGAGGEASVESTVPLVAGEWHHVVAVRNYASGLFIYVDGVLGASGSDSAGDVQLSSSVSRPNFLGYWHDYSGTNPHEYLTGSLKEVRFWPTPLDQAQIEANGAIEEMDASNGLIGLYRLDEGEGTTLSDATGINADGTVVGAATDLWPECDDTDEDGDGYTVNDGDCDDTDSTIYPYAGDSYGDGVDSDCDGWDCEAGEFGDAYFAWCVDTGQNRADAQAACENLGYESLASIQSASENGFVAALNGSTYNGYIWIGLHDQNQEGTYEWESGQEASYTNWYAASNEPNNGLGGGEDCVVMDPTDGSWNDVECALDYSSYAAFVCENRHGSGCGNGEITHTSGGVDFTTVCAGTFDMGCTSAQAATGDCNADESPEHSVELTHEFWISQTEVTQDQWMDLMGGNPSAFNTSAVRPVENVTWWAALEYANALSTDASLDECYALTSCSATANLGNLLCSSVTVNTASGSVYDCEGYRIPTEAEWEYAARAGTDTVFSGSDTLADVGWYSSNSVGNQTQEVGTTGQSNAWGLHDMSGNVWEWVWDWYGSSYYTANAVTDPEGETSGNERVCRGGGWHNAEESARVSFRGQDVPGNSNNLLGIRVVRTVPCDQSTSSHCTPSSCKDILDHGDSVGDGRYTIDPDGSGEIDVYCDMTTDGGGWTLAYSNYYEQGNPEHSSAFISSDPSYDVEYTTTTYTNSKVRWSVGFDQLLFFYDAGSGTTTTSVYTHTYDSILDIPPGGTFTYEDSLSTGRLPGFEANVSGQSTFYPATLYVGKTGAPHRNYYFSHFDTDSSNQAGLFVWSGQHSTGTLFGDVDEPLGSNATGFAEVYVR